MMRILVAAGVAVAALVTPAVDAQQMIAHGPAPAGYPVPGGYPAPGGYGYNGGGRWGSKVDGRWWGGANAPGGWHAYHRPHRGWTLPGYWVSPRFYIQDWGTYGLPQPPSGYEWSRYYDDAVLIDDRGSVYDTVGGIDWDGYAGAADVQPGYAPPPPYAQGAGYPPPADCGYYQRRNSGAGGAVVGGVVGGVAGNVIAGRGNRLAGTLIGAGVGAAGGYAIDRSRGHTQYGCAPAYSPAPPAYAPPPPPPVAYAPPPPPPPPPPPAPGWHSPDGGVTVVTTGGYYGGSTTVVTVQSPPVITTTTEVYEDRVVWHAPVRKVVRRHVWRPRCGCR